MSFFFLTQVYVKMTVVIEDDYLSDLFRGKKPKGKPRFGPEVIRGFQKCIAKIKNAQNSIDLRNIKSLHFEKLSGDLKGKYSVRVNDAYRSVFRLEADGNRERVEIIFVEELSNHYS